MQTTRFFLVLGVAASMAASAHAAPIISDDFESYADTAALGTSWTLGAGGTLNTAQGNPGQSLAHSGVASSHTKSFTSFTPTTYDHLSFSSDIYDDATSSNKRISAGIRTASGANIIEMGMYNGPGHYAYRVALFAAGSASNWFAFTNIVNDAGAPITNVPVAGWHNFSVLLTATSATFTLDLNSDGIINATATQPITFNAAGGMNIVRLGGPSAQSSAGGGVSFDNVLLEVVPEPTSLALVGLVGLAIKRRR